MVWQSFVFHTVAVPPLLDAWQQYRAEQSQNDDDDDVTPVATWKAG
jgi:hypothetical protein